MDVLLVDGIVCVLKIVFFCYIFVILCVCVYKKGRQFFNQLSRRTNSEQSGDRRGRKPEQSILRIIYIGLTHKYT